MSCGQTQQTVSTSILYDRSAYFIRFDDILSNILIIYSVFIDIFLSGQSSLSSTVNPLCSRYPHISDIISNSISFDGYGDSSSISSSSYITTYLSRCSPVKNCNKENACGNRSKKYEFQELNIYRNSPVSHAFQTYTPLPQTVFIS